MTRNVGTHYGYSIIGVLFTAAHFEVPPARALTDAKPVQALVNAPEA